jgi:hypothetical protein
VGGYHTEMSLPGLGLVAPPVRNTALFDSRDADSIQTAITAPITAAPSTAVHDLSPNSEWRFEVAINSKIDVKVRIPFGMPEVS